MSKLWSRWGVKRLQIGRGSGENRMMEYAMIGVLSAVILGSIVFVIYSFFGDKTGGSDSAANAPMHFKCTKCGEEFTLTQEEVAGGPQGMLMEEAAVVQVDCPKCGEKKCAMIMTQCPKCKKYYLAETTKQMAAQYAADPTGASAGPTQETVKDVCPYCGTDRLQWYRETYRKKKGR